MLKLVHTFRPCKEVHLYPIHLCHCGDVRSKRKGLVPSIWTLQRCRQHAVYGEVFLERSSEFFSALYFFPCTSVVLFLLWQRKTPVSMTCPCRTQVRVKEKLKVLALSSQEWGSVSRLRSLRFVVLLHACFPNFGDEGTELSIVPTEVWKFFASLSTPLPKLTHCTTG